ncbi:MAG: metallophosphoesterase [Deltaproteobacteria bacterium]|nr:metallophosphoesterase [Deltaproteobacteria bacterium]
MTGLKKFFLALCLALFLCPPADAAQDQSIGRKLADLEKITSSFTFAVIGDNRSGDDVYKNIISMVMERKPAFVVNVGDMIIHPGNLSEWENFWRLSGPITAPYFLTVGNHDVNNKASEDIYRQQVDLPGNELYYSFTSGNSIFIVLDTYFTGQNKKITAGQYAWLEKVLETTDKRHKFVFLHHPLYPDRLSFSGSLDAYPVERDRLRKLFVKHGVDTVFAGHLHLYHRKTFDGMPQIITGGAGATLIADDENGGFSHFILMTVEGEKVRGEVIDIDGKTRDKFTLNGQ